MKTIVKLKKDHAAIVFSPKGVQLIYPESEKEIPSYAALAASIVIALQHDTFLNFLADFTQRIAEQETGVSH